MLGELLAGFFNEVRRSGGDISVIREACLEAVDVFTALYEAEFEFGLVLIQGVSIDVEPGFAIGDGEAKPAWLVNMANVLEAG